MQKEGIIERRDVVARSTLMKTGMTQKGEQYRREG